MTVYITAIGPSSTSSHEHIASIRWLSSSDSTSKVMSMRAAVEWVQKGNKFVVAGESGPVEVQAVKANPPYLRTAANGSWTDNLLALPKF